MTRVSNSLISRWIVVMTVLTIFLFSSCTDTTGIAYSQFRSVPSGGWNTLDGREFSLFPDDTVARNETYLMQLCLRHDERVNYPSLWIEIEQFDNTGLFARDTVRVDLCDSKGTFYGTSGYGLIERDVVLDKAAHHRPGWCVGVRQIIRGPEVTGVENIGLILTETNKSGRRDSAAQRN